MSEERTINWILKNQAGLTPEPRIEITQAEAAIREIVRGWIPEEKEYHINNSDFLKQYKEGWNTCRQAMFDRIK